MKIRLGISSSFLSTIYKRKRMLEFRTMIREIEIESMVILISLNLNGYLRLRNGSLGIRSKFKYEESSE